MHPADAKKYGLRHGDKVKLITRRGEMVSYLDTRGRKQMSSGLNLHHLPLMRVSLRTN